MFSVGHFSKQEITSSVSWRKIGQNHIETEKRIRRLEGGSYGQPTKTRRRAEAATARIEADDYASLVRSERRS